MTDTQAGTDAVKRPEPTRGYRWAVLLTMAMAAYGSYYAFDFIGPMAPLLTRQLNFTNSNIGLLQAVYSLPNIVMVLFGGWIIDRIGAMRSVMLFAIITFVGLVVTALTPHLWVMAAGRLIVGAGAESLALATIVGNARWFRGKELSLSSGVKATILRFGSLTAQVSPTWGARFYTHWQGPLFLSVGFGGLCVVFAALYWILETRGEKRFDLGDAAATKKPTKVPLRGIFSFPPSFWIISLMCVTFYSGIFPFQTFAQKFFIQAKDATPQSASLLVGMLTLFTMVGTPLFGALADRIGKRALLMIVGSAMLIPVYLIMAYTNVPLTIPMAVMGIAFSLVPAVMWPAIAYVVEERRLGFAIGVMDAIQQLGLFLFNLMIGGANDHWEASVANPTGYAPGMWIFSATALAALLLGVVLRRIETGPHGHGLETFTVRG
jgi:MFS family permease